MEIRGTWLLFGVVERVFLVFFGCVGERFFESFSFVNERFGKIGIKNKRKNENKKTLRK